MLSNMRLTKTPTLEDQCNELLALLDPFTTPRIFPRHDTELDAAFNELELGIDEAEEYHSWYAVEEEEEEDDDVIDVTIPDFEDGCEDEPTQDDTINMENASIEGGSSII